MAKAHADAAAFIHAKPADALVILKKRFAHVDDKVLAKSFAVITRLTPSPPQIKEAAVENSDQFSIDAGVLSATDKLKSYRELFTNEFLK